MVSANSILILDIKYLSYQEINKQKWDHCIRCAANGMIYAESVYLDHIAVNWGALVLGDYEAVMPLVWKRKWGIGYLYQPAFFQQGGIFSAEKISSKTVKVFLEHAAEHFSFAEITLNHGNEIKAEKGLQVKMRSNFILPLGKNYSSIYKAYDSYIRQRLNRLSKFSLQYRSSGNISTAIKLYRKLYAERMPSVTSKDYKQFETLCNRLAKDKRVIIREVYNSDGKELLAVILLLKDEKRIYNIISCILPAGKKKLANYFLYDSLIKEFAEEKLVLDFEGSDIPGVAYFYSKFARLNEVYPFVKFNKLPLPIRLIKR